MISWSHGDDVLRSGLLGCQKVGRQLRHHRESWGIYRANMQADSWLSKRTCDVDAFVIRVDALICLDLRVEGLLTGPIIFEKLNFFFSSAKVSKSSRSPYILLILFFIGPHVLEHLAQLLVEVIICIVYLVITFFNVA
jgi:hypothetical protein